MKLDEKVIDQIVETVVRKLADQDSQNKVTVQISQEGTDITDGVFQDISVCIQAACKAQKELVAMPLEVRRRIIAAVRQTGSANAAAYGSMEFEETGLGKLEDNVKKNISACEVMGMEDLVPEILPVTKGSRSSKESRWASSPPFIRLPTPHRASCSMPS